MKLEIDPEIVDKIIVEEMLERFERISKDLNTSRTTHPEDVARDEESLQAIKVILSDYMIPNEYEIWLNSH